ncbi:LysE family translocator [Rhizobium sp. AAP43]|uniref:LysE family translocator n=1 Tax=Rhizobium sp. AAP43 TaxID=1523420 RepID=UPI0006B98F6A|nr:LysE family translocator [Rhizobium sp. AAP43]KPF41436.1 lysine transporter LysE [Rhizobium sp. AAP43]
MTLNWILSVVLFTIASSGSPGPNNMLLTTTGANHGFARSLPHVFGTGVGICLIFLGLAAFGSQLLQNETFRDVLKWGGVLYLAWLAFKIATSRPDTSSADGDSAKPLTFFQAILFQGLNPKVWLGGASGILSFGSSSEGWSALAMSSAFAVLFAVISMPCAAVWALLGSSARYLLKSTRSLRIFNISMAALLLASLVPVVLS